MINTTYLKTLLWTKIFLFKQYSLVIGWKLHLYLKYCGLPSVNYPLGNLTQNPN